MDGRRLTRTADLADLISARDAGDEVKLEVLRDGKRRDGHGRSSASARTSLPSDR